VGFFDHFIDRGMARIAIADAYFGFDEFVMLQCLVQFGGQPGGYPTGADVDDRFEVVCEGAQVFFLFFIQLHHANYNDHGQRFIQ